MNKTNTINSITRRLLIVGITASVCTYIAGCRTYPGHKNKKETPLNILEIRENVPSPYVDPSAKSGLKLAPAPAAASVPANKGAGIELVLPKTIANPNMMTGEEILTVDFTPAPVMETKKVAAKKPEPLPEVVEPQRLTYAVKKGDTLWDIARAYGISTNELAAENLINLSDLLKVGAVLRIPPGGAFIPVSQRPVIKKQEKRKSVSAALVSKQAVPSSGKHIVKKGDTLWDIAQTYGVKVDALKKLNRLTDDVLHPGQLLILRDLPSARPVVVKPVHSRTQQKSHVNTTPKSTNTEVDVAIHLSDAGKGSPMAAGTDDADMKLKNLPHFISDGDTLKSIAEMYGSKVEWILNENSTIKTDNDLKNGLEIQVPCPEL